MISGLRREVYENCALVGYHVAYSGNSLLTFQDNLLVPTQKSRKPIITQNSAVLREDHVQKCRPSHFKDPDIDLLFKRYRVQIQPTTLYCSVTKFRLVKSLAVFSM